jgi:hypothetical protein
MAALGDFRGIFCVEVGEEVGAIVSQRAERELELIDQFMGEFAFNGFDVVFLKEVHVIPEGLAGKLPGGSGQELYRSAEMTRPCSGKLTHYLEKKNGWHVLFSK